VRFASRRPATKLRFMVASRLCSIAASPLVSGVPVRSRSLSDFALSFDTPEASSDEPAYPAFKLGWAPSRGW